jgi:hypothetical protein
MFVTAQASQGFARMRVGVAPHRLHRHSICVEHLEVNRRAGGI